MMPDAVRQIIEASGGSVVGKTRLQKIAYLLEAGGVGYGFEFDYHYYGPYSEELATATQDAQALGLIAASVDAGRSGVVTFGLPEGTAPSGEDAAFSKRRNFLAKLSDYDTTTLELAATADFLAKNGFRRDPWLETKRRKTIKASEERITKAKRLLTELFQQTVARS